MKNTSIKFSIQHNRWHKFEKKLYNTTSKEKVMQHNFKRKRYATQLIHKKLYNTPDVHKYSQQLMHIS